MKVLDVFSWLPAKEISIEELQQIFMDHYNGTYAGKYTVSLEMPDNADKNIFDSAAELVREGRNVAYILESGKVIAVIGYSSEIHIDFGHPYFDEKTIFNLQISDLDSFYQKENEVNQLNLFFVLEASLHRFQNENKMKAAARCAFLMAYYLFTPLTPPASFDLAEHYIDKALEWDETPEYHEWKDIIDKGN